MVISLIMQNNIKISLMRNIKWVLLLFGLIFLFGSCISAGKGDQPVSSDGIPATSPVVDLEKYELGESAFVETADALILESFPLQVNIRITGNLPDGCTMIYQTESKQVGNLFNVKILTLREKEAMCTQALVPFEISVPLDVLGLPAGTYQVMVYDVITEFTFTQDNIIQNSEESN